MTPSIDVTVDSIAAGGDGVARAGGLVVFIPRSAPGDVGRVEVSSRGRFARAELTELRVRSPQRTEPQCAHYEGDRCGGCQLQHLVYPAQVAAKARIVRDALVRIGKRQVEEPPVHESSLQWRYRRKLTLALRRRGGRWSAGLHPFDAPSRIFALRDCPITDERVLDAWREVLAASANLPEAAELRGAVRLDDVGASFTLEGGTAWRRSDAFFAATPLLRSVWWRPHGRRRRLLHDRGGGGAPGSSFAQVNAAVANALRRRIVERVDAYTPRHVVDGYAGLGDVAIELSHEGIRVTAVELDRDATIWCAKRLAPGSRAIAARVEDALADALPADLVLLNPPRVGVDQRVTATLEAADPPPRAVLYVSCNPATLGRDLARLPRYRVVSLEAFDMFPQTAHVETLCELVPEAT